MRQKTEAEVTVLQKVLSGMFAAVQIGCSRPSLNDDIYLSKYFGKFEIVIIT